MRHPKYTSHLYNVSWQHILLVCCLWLGLSTAQAATYTSAATTFSWVDPTSHTAVTWTSGASCSSGYASAPVDDDITAQLPLGFTFNFGGVNYTTVQVMSNGRLQFGNGFCGAGTNAPGSQVPRTYPYPYADGNLLRTMKVYAADIDMSAGGSVKYASIGTTPNRQFVVTWTNAPEWNAGAGSGANSSFNLQVVLKENGDFVFQYGTSNNTSHGNAQIGWEVTATDYALIAYPPDTSTTAGNSSNLVGIGSLTNTAIRFFIPATLAEYRLEESAWSGANSIINTTSTSFNGTPSGALASTASGYICRGASIPLNTAKGTVDAINTGIGVYTNMNSVGSVSFWYKGLTAWNDGVDRMLLDATSNNSAPFFFMKRTDGSLRFVLQDSANNIFVTASGAHSFAANTWHHIAVTWAMGSSARMIIYLDGVIDKQYNLTTSSSLSSIIGSLFIGDNQSKAVSNNPTDNSAYGTIDEVRIYNYEIPLTVVNRDRLASHPCGSALNNFLITVGAAAASTCQPKNITITARDTGNATLTGYTGTVSLSTSTGHGDWSKVTANGSLTNGSADSGAASYSFVGTDSGTITLALSNTHADDLTLGVTDAGASVSATSSTLNFRDNVFVITPTDALGTTVVAGRPHAIKAELWRKDLTTGNCSIATGYTGVKTIKSWLTRTVDDPAGAAPAINAVSLPNASPYANVSLTFTAGVTTFNFNTSDVGKYAINLIDDSRSFASGVDITGASSTLTTRPFGLAITNIKKNATTNPGGANSSDAVFIGAGHSFQATVGGYLWQGADDTDNDGTPDATANLADNTLAPKFAWPLTLTRVLNTPGAGFAGTLGGTTSILQASFSGGAVTVSDLTYSEVGSIKITASGSNYLNSGGVNLSTTSSIIGRFIPDHFATSALVNGTLNNGCGTFTYTGQQSGGVGAINYATRPQFDIAAQNLAGGTTRNYTGAFAKLTAGGITLTGTDTVNAGLNANLKSVTLTPISGADGTFAAVLGNDDFYYTRNSSALIAPYISAIKLNITDVKEPVGADGVAANDLPKSLLPEGPGATAGVEIRFGRLNLQNAYGSELIDLPINLTAEYWSGTTTGFVTNTSDVCTAVAAGNVTVTPYSPVSGTSLVVAVNPFVAGTWHTSGSGPYTHLTKPSPTNQGSVDLTVDLDAAGLGWLKYDWDGVDQPAGTPDGNLLDDNPTARAVFGIYQGPQRRIYLRERFN